MTFQLPARKAEAWLVLKANRSSYGNTYRQGPYAGQLEVTGVKIIKIAQNKPAVSENEIAMKIELDVDVAHFLDGVATIKATLPAPDPDDMDIPVTVDIPIKPRGKSAAAARITGHP